VTLHVDSRGVGVDVAIGGEVLETVLGATVKIGASGED
jgi:hypothetical protein